MGLNKNSHWAEKLETGDRCLGTIRHKTDGSKNLANVKSIVIVNHINEKTIEAYFLGENVKIPYNELKEL